MLVQVYRNLHRKCWSIRDKRTRLVVDHQSILTLSDCTFKVSEAGRQRVLATGRKNVHAFVEGTRSYDRKCEVLDQLRDAGQLDGVVRVSYNPHKGPSFVREDTGEAVTRAALVVMGSIGVLAYGVS